MDNKELRKYIETFARTYKEFAETEVYDVGSIHGFMYGRQKITFGKLSFEDSAAPEDMYQAFKARILSEVMAKEPDTKLVGFERIGSNYPLIDMTEID